MYRQIYIYIYISSGGKYTVLMGSDGWRQQVYICIYRYRHICIYRYRHIDLDLDR